MNKLLCAALLSFCTSVNAGAFTDDEYIYDMPVGLVHAIEDLATRGLEVRVLGCKVELMRCYTDEVTVFPVKLINRELDRVRPKEGKLSAIDGIKVGNTVFLKGIYYKGDIALSVFAMDDKAVFILKD